MKPLRFTLGFYSVIGTRMLACLLELMDVHKKTIFGLTALWKSRVASGAHLHFCSSQSLAHTTLTPTN